MTSNTAPVAREAPPHGRQLDDLLARLDDLLERRARLEQGDDVELEPRVRDGGPREPVGGGHVGRPAGEAHDEAAARGRSERALDLVHRAERRGRLPELVRRVRRAALPLAERAVQDR
jgi:hypothetical protein